VLQPQSAVSTGTTWTVEAGVFGAQEG
jgi:hypothetical protein